MTQRPLTFDSKAAARGWAWDRLQAERLARFPFPPHGRIPNFVGADLAAQRLFAEPEWREARAIKVNPDSPQKHVRYLALSLGIRVYVPTPRLAGGFQLLDPERIDPGDFEAAAALNTMAEHSVAVALADLPQLDAIVTGCAAVTGAGKRCGKGEGYSDLEFAILRELGHAPVPVGTTVHDAQIVDDFPVEANDLPLTVICTPTRTVRVVDPLSAPTGIDWSRLDADDLARMPLLEEVKALQGSTR
ncbi:MAG TPA: 5-formyltetrahydrofolate cyclo-ligase [Pseudomonadales bacterium]